MMRVKALVLCAVQLKALLVFRTLLFGLLLALKPLRRQWEGKEL